MRIEAQKIHDELSKKGSKRTREESESQEERKQESREVSFVGESASAPAPRNDPPRDTSAIPCRNFANYRSVQIRQHLQVQPQSQRSNSPARPTNRPFPPTWVDQQSQCQQQQQQQQCSNSNRNNGSRGDNICFSWRDTGRCTRGANCRFQHPAANGARPAQEHSGAAASQKCIQSAHRKESATIASSWTPALRSTSPLVVISSVVSCRSASRSYIRGAFGEPVVAKFYGDAYIPVGEGVYLVVPEMVLCESLRDTLLSMAQLIKRGHRVDVNAAKGTGVFIDRSDEFTIPVSLQDNIFTFDFQQHEVNVTTRARFRSEHEPAAAQQQVRLKSSEQQPRRQQHPIPRRPFRASSQLAHARYGHLCGRKLDQLIDAKGADGMVTMHKHRSHRSLISKCDACMLAKAKRESFGIEMNHGANAPNDKLVGDVIGPISISKLNSAGDEETDKFYISMLTDVWSRQTSALIMPEKKPSDHVISYMHRSKIATGRDLKHFHTDGGKEYNRAERALEARGVKVTRTPIHTPQWNAIAERKNRTIIECARALLLHASLDPDRFWSYAVETAVFLHNRVIVVNPQGKTAHELFTGQKPDLSLCRVFGCKAIVRSADEHPGKFAPRGQMGIFVGYDTKRELCYRVLVGDKIVVSRDVQFDEDQFPAADKDNTRGDGTLKAKIDRCLSGASAACDNDDSADENGGDEQDPSAMSDSDEEPKIDARTLRKIAAREKITKTEGGTNTL